MKRLYIFSILFFPILLLGQSVNHFGNLDSRWNVAKTFPAANQQNPTFVATTTTVFGFQGDTIINDEQWLRLYSTYDSSFQNNLSFRGLIRSVDNKVFYRNASEELHTIYDFNMEVGDSVLYNMFGIYPEWLFVTEVDSIVIAEDFYKRIKFSEPSMIAFDELNEIWIEGIGSIHGPLFPNAPVKFSEEIPDSMLVSCTFSNNEQVWQHPSYLDCYVHIVLSTESVELVDFKIYPNPFSENIYIESDGIGTYDLTILNSTGQVVRSMKTVSQLKAIDLSELTKGIYFLTIANQGRMNTMKIVKCN